MTSSFVPVTVGKNGLERTKPSCQIIPEMRRNLAITYSGMLLYFSLVLLICKLILLMCKLILLIYKFLVLNACRMCSKCFVYKR